MRHGPIAIVFRLRFLSGVSISCTRWHCNELPRHESMDRVLLQRWNATTLLVLGFRLQKHDESQKRRIDGPFLFSLALKALLRRLIATMRTAQTNNLICPKQMFLSFHLDGILLIGIHHVLAAAYRLLISQEAVRIGLHLNLAGTKVRWPTPPRFAMPSMTY